VFGNAAVLTPEKLTEHKFVLSVFITRAKDLKILKTY